MDQAQRLRELLDSPSSETSARIIAVSSGKGGVGKTNFTVNLAIALAKLGKRVTIIDADLGLANVDVLLGIITKANLLNVINGDMEAKDIVEQGPHGINIVSGGSGIAELANVDEEILDRLISALAYFNSISDYILFDTGAGIGKSVLSFVASAGELIVLMNPDPTSLTDAYALIKNIESASEKSIKLVINRAESSEEARDAFDKVAQTVHRFLGIEVHNLGYILEDHNLKKAVKKQTPVLVAYPRSLASKAIENIAMALDSGNIISEKESGFGSFLSRLLKHF